MSAGIRQWLPGEVFAGQTRQVRDRAFILSVRRWQVGEKGASLNAQGMQKTTLVPEREPERVDGRGLGSVRALH